MEKDKTVILYIHGFNSGPGKKVDILKKEFPNFDVICPQLVGEPLKDIITLFNIVKLYPSIHIIGTSLGGFYAMLLNTLYNWRLETYFYIINPSINPEITLSKYLGKELENTITGEKYTLTEKFFDEITALKSHYHLFRCGFSGVTFFIGTKDTTLNFNELLEKLNETGKPYNINYSDQDHRFENILPVISQIYQNVFV